MTGFGPNELRELLGDALEVIRAEIGVELRPDRLLLLFEDVLEFGRVDVEDDLSEHLNEASIGVIGESRIVRPSEQSFQGLGI